MTRLFSLFFVSLILSQEALAHKEWVHQYQAKQAYLLLLNQLGVQNIPGLTDHFGFNSSGPGSGTWVDGNVVIGAWREDIDDPVWNVGGPNFGIECGFTASSTHFWNADAGDGSTINIPLDLDNCPEGGGEIPNAYYKALLYAEGFWWLNYKPGTVNLTLQAVTGHWLRFEPLIPDAPMQIPFYYQSLADLYKTKRMNVDFDSPGQNYRTFDLTLNRYVAYRGRVFVTDQMRDAFVWELLGRIAHLIGDMSVPAHTHNDVHPCWIHINYGVGTIHIENGDYYENFMGGSTCCSDYNCNNVVAAVEAYNWTWQQASAQGPFVNVVGRQNPIRYLMYSTNQIADHFGSLTTTDAPAFDSRWYPGDNNYNPTYGSDHYGQLQSIMNTIGPPIVNETDFQGSVQSMSSFSFLFSIRALAGLFHWFCVEADLINPLPSITSLLPSTALAGGPEFTLTVYGSGFVNGSTIRWNSSNRTTTYISDAELRGSILASDVATVATASVTVFNPAPGGGTSNPSTFTITPLQVSVDQRRESNQQLTGTPVGRWEGGPNFALYTVPIEPFGFTIGSREVLRGYQQLVTTPSEKYRVWERNFVAQLDTVQNHRGFTIRQDDANFISRFNPTDPTITIKTDLLDAPGTTGGNIQFRDPWYIDFQDTLYGNNWRNRGMQEARYLTRSLTGLFAQGWQPDFTTTYPESPNHPYRGVFLNQGEPNFTRPPYYSVGAPQPNIFTINNQNYTAYFQSWTGNASEVQYRTPENDTTAVVFKTSGATAVAKYKGHLISSSAQVTAFNTQRKVVRDRYGAYHMVYESGNLIWYTRSTNEGATWSPEQNITGMFAEPYIVNRWPSLTYIPDRSGAGAYDRILVVWEAFASGKPEERHVVVCELDIYGVVRSSANDMAYWITAGPSYPPVVGVMTDASREWSYYALVAWYNGERGVLTGMVRLQENSWSSPASDLLPGVTDYSLAPLTLRREGAPAEVDTLWHLAYVQNNNLMYASFRLNSMGYPKLRRTETVAMGYDGVYMRRPSIAVNNTNVVVSWQEDYWEFVTGAVRFSERILQDQWTNPVGWLPTWGYYQNPTIAADNLHDRITVAWQDAGSIYGPASFYVQRAGGGADWGGVSVLGAGIEPTLAAGMPGSVGELAATRTAATVHRVNVYAFGYPDDMRMKLNTVTAYGSGARIRFSHGVVHAAVLSAACNGQRLTFPALSDTTRIGTLGQLQQQLVSEPFEGNGTLQFRALFSSRGQLPNTVSLAIVLRDGQTREVLRVLRGFAAGNDTLLSLSVPLTYGTRRVVVALAATNFGRPRGFELERWYEPEGSSSTPASPLARTTGAESLVGQLPQHYALHGNHPNPFNPSTTIRYDLPEASHVSLTIYDVLGRKVAELVNGVQQAGFRSVEWNASGVASGVYLARFAATDASGRVQLSRVIKLLLTK